MLTEPRIVLDPALSEGLAERNWHIDRALHEKAVERVAAMYARCLAERSAVPAAYLPGGEWKAAIEERSDIHGALARGDLSVASELLEGFWRGPSGVIVKEYATFDQLRFGDEAATNRFLKSVRRNHDIWRRMTAARTETLSIPDAGKPWGLVIDGVLVAPKACRFDLLERQVSELVRDHRDPIIAEIGAGYGGMAHYLLRRSSERRMPLRYINFDLPETLVLAAYYLIMTLPDQRVALYGESACASGEAEALLLPNHALLDAASESVDVLVNTFSFSEMPEPTLCDVLRQVTRLTRGFLLHHNMDRSGVVQRGFERIPASRFPIDPSRWRLLHTGWDDFHGPEGDYRTYLYARVGSTLGRFGRAESGAEKK